MSYSGKSIAGVEKLERGYLEKSKHRTRGIKLTCRMNYLIIIIIAGILSALAFMPVSGSEPSTGIYDSWHYDGYESTYRQGYMAGYYTGSSQVEYLKVDVAPRTTIGYENARIEQYTLTVAGMFGEYYITTVTGTGSMRPLLEEGATIILEKPHEIVIGDVVVYVDENGCDVIHRIVRDIGDYWICKGDHNDFEDDPVYKGAVTWRLLGILY